MRSLRLYAWLPRSSVVEIQAIIDAYEGLARVRTERHDVKNDESLLLFLLSPGREDELIKLLSELSRERQIPVRWQSPISSINNSFDSKQRASV